MKKNNRRRQLLKVTCDARIGHQYSRNTLAAEDMQDFIKPVNFGLCFTDSI